MSRWHFIDSLYKSDLKFTRHGRPNNQFSQDVWLINNFPCKALESSIETTIYTYIDVSGSSRLLF